MLLKLKLHINLKVDNFIKPFVSNFKRFFNKMKMKSKTSQLFNDFFESEKSGGIILVLATLLSLFLSNSEFQVSYLSFWKTSFQGHSITHWINDGLMTIFFLLIGLELEREIYHGELSNFKTASLPFFGALGGMIVPACIFLLFNFGTSTQSGAGIPMATDIAFAVGILSLLGSRVPTSLKIFLTALAVIDDLGAIIIIAIFYTSSLSIFNLGIAFVILGILFIFNRMKVHNFLPYLIGGIAMWYFMLHSGVHPSITGVLIAFVIPFGDGSSSTISSKLQQFLHKPVAYFILPLFALANTAIPIGANFQSHIFDNESLGIILGLVLGKPFGIVLFSFLGVSLSLCALPKNLKWSAILGAGFLGGIGFTMSIFITLLAFDASEIINTSKIAILIASFIAGVIGFSILKVKLKNS
jgi:Na+:H+ antiporter, NhaA family